MNISLEGVESVSRQSLCSTLLCLLENPPNSPNKRSLCHLSQSHDNKHPNKN